MLLIKLKKKIQNQVLALGTLVITVGLVGMLIGCESNHDQKFESFMQEHWQKMMDFYPEWAASLGYPNSSDRWSDMSVEAIVERQQWFRELHQRLQKISAVELNAKNQLNYQLLNYQLGTWVESYQYPSHLLAISQLDGVHRSAADSLARMPREKEQHFEDILKRMEKLPKLIDQHTNLLRIGLDQQILPPKIIMRDVPEQIRSQIEVDLSKNPLMQAFRELPASIPEPTQSSIKQRAETLIRELLIPKFSEHLRFVEGTYIPACRETIGISALKNGQEWYAHAARYSTTTDLSPEQIHQIGLNEVARIRKEMDRVIEESGFKGDFAAFTDFLRTDKQFYFNDAKTLLTEYLAIAKKVDPALMKLFSKLPRLPYGILPVPEFMEKSAPTAYYHRGSAQAHRPGYFFANTYDLKSRPSWEMEALTLHEAVPGHHLQIALAQEEDLPEFRKYGGYTAYVEGWALYAESLGEDLGFYKDPYSKFGKLTYEIWRAVRLVVDTGMHSLGWSRQQAIDFFKENTGKGEHDIVVEVDRYIVWPGQALAYKMGELKIKELRARAEHTLGDRFDIRAFHDRVLSDGALPLAVLENRINAWIDQQNKELNASK